MTRSRKTTRGTQALERAVTLLKTLAARSSVGWRLTDLAAQCELDKSTAHRLLRALERHRLVRQRSVDLHYAPGPLLFELGLAFPALAQLQAACRPALARLSRAPGGAALLYIRSEEEFVCIAREGGAGIRGLSVEVGTRRPLVVSAPGIAMLLALPEDEGARILEANMLAVRRFGDVRVRAVQAALRRSRDMGAALNLGDIVPGLWSFGVPVHDAGGAPFAAIGLTGPVASYSLERVPEIVEALRKEARRIESDCAQLIVAIRS